MTVDELVRTHQSFNDTVVRNDLAELSNFYADDYILVRPDEACSPRIKYWPNSKFIQ
jgi:ketosteroid isomerase-like protein